MDNCVIVTLPEDIIIQTIWSDECIRIGLVKEKKGYSGTLSKSSLKTTANALELDFDDILAETKNALCTQNGFANFTYTFTNDSNSFKFSKSTGAFRITYGEVQLENKPDIITEILINSIKLNEKKERDINVMRSEMRRMDETFSEMKTALQRCVEEKTQIENTLLTKFAALLNAKKEKISELEAVIKNRSTVPVESDFESDGSGDSDVDYSSQTYVREKVATPSTSKQSADDSVIVVVPPKRSKGRQTLNEAIVDEVKNTSKDVTEAKITPPNSMDIYEQETEVLFDDM